MAKRRGSVSPAQHVIHHAARLHAHTRVALRTVLLLCGAVGLAAVAAALTVRQSTVYLGVSLASSLKSSVQQPGSPSVPMVGLRLHAYGQPVSVRHLSFSVLTDRDGQFENGVANDVDAVQALPKCSLTDAAGKRLSGPVAPSSASRTLDFSLSLDLKPQQNADVRVLCDVGTQTGPGPGSDQLALALNGPQSVQTALGTTPLPVSAVSFGWSNKPLNDRGADVSVWRGRPASAASVENTAAPAVPAPSAAPVAGVTVAAVPAASVVYLLPHQKGTEIARFRFDAGQPTTIRALTFVNCLGYDGNGNCTGAREGAGDARFVNAVHFAYADAAGTMRTVSAVPDANGTLSFPSLALPVAKSSVISLLADTGAFDPSLSGTVSSFAFVDTGSFDLSSDKTVSAAFKADGPLPTTFLTDDATPGLSGVASGVTATFVKSRPALSRPAASPDGSARPGMGEALRFTVAAQGDGPVDVFGVAFAVKATDRTGNNWLSCDQIATSTKWGLRDAGDLSTRLEDPGDWSFYQADGTPCISSGTLAYAAVDFTRAGDPQAKAVAKNSARTFVVRVDTSGAAPGDTFRLDMPAQPVPGKQAVSPLRWTDTWLLKPAAALGVPGLPLSGGTLRF